MINEQTLADPTTCPSCGNTLAASPTCPTCRVDLGGPVGARVWTVSLQVAALLDERRDLVDQLRRAVPGQHSALPAVPVLPTPVALPAPLPRKPPAPEWTRRRVQNLLLSLGVGLLAVAAVIFLVVSWSVLGIGGRAAVMLGCTALAAAGAATAQRRTLTATAEAVSLLTVGLALLDAWGARNAGLAGLDQADGALYWGLATAAIAGLSALGTRVVPTRSLRQSAAVLALLPVPLLSFSLADHVHLQLSAFAAGLTLGAAAELALVARWPFAARDARVTILVGGLGTASVAVLAALGAAYAEPGSLVPGTVLLLALAVGAGLAGRVQPAVATPAAVLATALVVAAGWAPVVDQASSAWAPVGLAAVVVALLALAALVPAPLRSAPVATLAVALAGPALAVAGPLAASVGGHLQALDKAWSATASGSALARLGDAVDLVGGDGWGAEVPVLLLTVLAGLALLGTLHRWLADWLVRATLAAGAVVVTATALVAPVAAGLTFTTALGADAAVAAALLVAGGQLWRAADRLVAGTLLGSGTVLAAFAVSWSFAAQTPTLLVLPVAATALALAAWRCGGPTPAALPRLPLAVLAGTAGLVEVAALTRAADGGWPAVAALTLAVTTVLASAAAWLVPGDVRVGLVTVASTAALADVTAVFSWLGRPDADAGLALTVAAAVLVAAAVAGAPWLVPGAVPAPLQRAVAGPGALGAVMGVLVTFDTPDRLWLALLAAGVGAAVAAFRPELHRAGWLAGGLLTASSWVRLIDAHVSSPEPYTVPAGAALVALGMLRRRQDRDYPSWRAYATGLSLALVPSLVRAVTDTGSLRPTLLAVAALAVLGAGLTRRLQAPLVVGGAVLAVDALVQLSPYLAEVYAAVPRWTVFAAAGLLLLGVGATYEQRAREVRALRHQVSQFS